MSIPSVAEVARAKYVMVTTYKKDGTAVASPLWAAPDSGDLLLWTVADSWKVKRLRRNNNVLVQACDARGSKTSGPVVAGVGEIIDGTVAARAIERKYGLLGKLTILGSRLRRGSSGTVGIRVRDVV
ncbi:MULTISPECIES: PPOX class F420-dependent oxidoreductase [unclassified Gordonia (in: high G+C Gram-positive bacteria)]|uniref:PPOX class F420-dependent oxidoreductase n=1 Tax=unclassified Gordonia (in: high G+C Gram-positive bacteria) TaxID=2657482 RepID=UPI001FFEF4F4|nr:MULTISPECIES: PPOX class F420-dependent oxidoreductase [unclassified Gordonia (in: high G+C Gram-positive bacteria)]UQE75485.1 PPOX class F420-dependent oxidoreductase [Gordonia sp. PP30]